MPAIITTHTRLLLAKQFFNQFAAATPDTSLYLFVGKVTPWDNEMFPPVPLNNDVMVRQAWRDMIGGKKVSPSDFSHVVRRVDWESDKVFARYDDAAANLFFTDFYCVTDDFNIYKCIDNAGGQPSLVKPTGTGTSVITLGDGYKWKYMATVSIAQAVKFLTPQWVPVATLEFDDGSPQWSVQQTSIYGGIHAIEVTNNGADYLSPPTVTIVGDGTGATAVAVMAGAVVERINITNPGTGYTYAEVQITGGDPSLNAEARPIYAPMPVGHGRDVVQELGGFYVMVNAELQQDEVDNLPTTNDFRNIGLLADPLDSSTDDVAQLSAFSQCTRMVLSAVSGTFDQDIVVEGLLSGAKGKVVQWQSATSTLDVNDVVGSFVPGEGIICTSGNGVVDVVVAPELRQFSGQIIVMENRAPIPRADDQTEQVRVIFEF